VVAEGWSLSGGGTAQQVVPYSWRSYPAGGPLLVAKITPRGPLLVAADTYNTLSKWS